MKAVSIPENLLEELKHGRLLLRTDASNPEAVQMEKKQLAPGWTIVSSRSVPDLDREITRAGWHLFFIPPEFRVAAIARDQGRTAGKALMKMLAQAEARKMNALEITGVSVKKWAGFYRASIRGVLRHLQKSYLLFHEPERASQQTLPVAA